MCDARGRELNEGGKPWWGRRCGSRAGARVNPQVPALFCSLLSSLHMHEHRSSPRSRADSYVQETVSPSEEMGSARRRARVHLSKQKRRGKKLGLAQSALGNICTHAHAHTHTHTPVSLLRSQTREHSLTTQAVSPGARLPTRAGDFRKRPGGF